MSEQQRGGKWTTVGQCDACGAPYWIDQDYQGDACIELPPPCVASCRCIPKRGMPVSVRHLPPVVEEVQMGKKERATPRLNAEGQPHPADHEPVPEVAYYADLGLVRCMKCGWEEVRGDTGVKE